MESLYRTTSEIPDRITGKVRGSIPNWLVGSLYRNGPGAFEVGDSEYNHWFDGLALLHCFEIYDGAVTYHSKYVESETHAANTKANRIIISEYGTAAYPDPCKNIFQRMFSVFKQPVRTDNTLVSVTPLSDFIYTATETNKIHKIDPKSLKTIDTGNIEEHVVVNVATAHMLRDPDGTLHNLGKSYKGKPKYSFVKIPVPTDGKGVFDEAEIVGSVPFRWSKYPTYLHSFGMSERYYVFVELAFCIRVWNLMASNLTNQSFHECLKWYGEEKNLFHIVDRETGKEVCPNNPYIADPFFMFHHINTYEEDGTLIVDVVGYNDAKILDLHYLKNLRSEKREEYPEPTVRRYVLPLSVDEEKKTGDNLLNPKTQEATAVLQKDGSVLCGFETLAEIGLELPEINSMYRAKKHRYIYGAGGPYMNKVVKIDAGTHEALTWQEEGVYVSEPIFVISPGRRGSPNTEEDGVLLVVLYQIKEPRHVTSLLVLDPRTMTELGRADFDVPVPRDIHGCFVIAR